MLDIIQQLPDHVANQIAAGEVVQRPASVVKELLENAVDAKATDIQLIVKDSGKTLVQVIDNGDGMTHTDLRMAFERHATSKIRDAEDLFNLSTKGFRGEALASIAAVAHVRCVSCLRDAKVANSLLIEGGKVANYGEEAHPSGTSIEVRNLFYNIPARRQFLKSDAIELNHITDEFQRVALAHPYISFRFYHNNSLLFQLPESSLKLRITNVFGKKFDQKLVPVEEETEHVRIYGFTGKPDAARKRRGEQFFFVNDRFIRYQKMHYAVMKAYEDLLPQGMHPPYFIFIEVDPSTIDVNIHPTKTEIQFNDENMIFSMLASSVKHSLGKHNVVPSMDFEIGQAFSVPKSQDNRPLKQPQIKVNADYNPFSNPRPNGLGGSVEPKKPATRNWEALMVKSEDVPEATQAEIWSDPNEHKSASTTVAFAGWYILHTQGDDVHIIHPRRAHERVLYESLLKTIQASTAPSQQLLFPQSIELSKADVQRLQPWVSNLISLGFDMEIDDKHNAMFYGLPVTLNESALPEVLDELLADLQESDRLDEDRFQRALIKNLAKNGAIKSINGMEAKDLEGLVRDLFQCHDAELSLHGKPTMYTLAINELEKYFH